MRRSIAGDLDNILAKALRKDPRERYPSVAALSEDLDRYLDHRPVRARPATWRYRTAKFIRRNRGGVTGAVLVTLALITTTGAAVYQTVQTGRQRDALLVALRRQLAFATMQDVLADDTRGAGGKPLSGSERLRLAMVVLRETYRNEPRLIAEGLIDLSARAFQAGDRGREREALASAVEVASGANLPELVAAARCGRAYSFVYDDALDSARADLAEARLALARNTADITIVLTCQRSDASRMLAEGHTDSALAVLTRIVQRQDRATLEEGFSLTDRLGAISDLSQALRGMGRTREATDYQRRAIASLDSSGFGPTSTFASTVSILTASLSELGEYAETREVLAPIIRRQEELWGQGQAAPQLQFLYGLAFLRLGELDSAELWMGRSVRDSSSVDYGVAMWAPPAMTQLRLDQGRLPEARREVKLLPTGTPTRQANAALFPARIRWQSGDSLGALVHAQWPSQRHARAGQAWKRACAR